MTIVENGGYVKQAMSGFTRVSIRPLRKFKRESTMLVSP